MKAEGFAGGIEDAGNFDPVLTEAVIKGEADAEGGPAAGAETGRRGRKPRGENSREMVALDKYLVDIETAEQLYGDGLPYEVDRIENEIRFYQEQAGAALLEMGKCFLRIKAHEEYGRFMKAIENVGMAERSVRYAMAAARKFSDRQTFADLGTSKLVALSVLDDDDIQRLDAGGDIAGITLDDIDRMTVRELKQTLRKGEERAAKLTEQLKRVRKDHAEELAQKEAKINQLDDALNGREPLTREQLAAAAVQRYRDPVIDNILEATERMKRATAAIDEAQKIPHVPYEALEDLVSPYKEDFNFFCDAAEDLTNAFNNIHVDKGKTDGASIA